MEFNTPFRAGLWLLSLTAAFAGGHLFTKNSSFEEDSSLTNEYSHSRETLSRPSSSKHALASFPFIPKGASNREIVVAIASHDGAPSRMQAFLAFLDTLKPADFPSAISVLKQSGLVGLREDEYGLLFSAWAEVRPEEAIAFASNQFNNTLAKNAVLETWARHSPEAALQWAQENYSNPYTDETNPWLLGIVRGTVANNLDFAASVVDSMPLESPERSEGLNAILGHLRAKDPDKALQWAESIEDEESRSSAISLLAQKIVQSDPLKAYEQVRTLNDGQALKVVAEELTHHRYLEDPQNTKEWLRTLPEGAIGGAANVVVAHETKQDPIGTAQWMAELILESNPDENYQNAIRTLIEESTLIDPQVSAEWLVALDSEKDRNRLYQEVISEWREQGEVSAEDWVKYNYDHMPEGVLLRFYPDFVPEIDIHNRDESVAIGDES